MIGIIGHGNIGKAIADGLRKKRTELMISDKIQADDEMLYSSNTEIIFKCNIVFICIAPSDFEDLASEINDVIKKDTLLVSLSPNHSLQDLRELFNHTGVIRYMPNTSITINKGVSVISHEIDEAIQANTDFQDCMEKLGYVHLVDESLINSTIGVAGSGIAIVFELLEGMGMAGILNGLPKELSYQMAAETLIGAGEMYLRTQKHPAELRDQVCSPGGITIKAVAKLEENSFKGTIIKAIKETI